MTASPFGVYVHIPFCARRCDYCAFATWTDRDALIGRYLDACVADIVRSELPPATSVFFGGGTPSLVPAGALMVVLDAIPRAAGCEVTVECNPESATADKLAVYARRGVTRVSFGVQSMVPHVLRALGREHDVAAVHRAVGAAADAGIARTSVDLIYGARGETPEDWLRTIDAVLGLEPRPSHLSAYALTVEPGTPLARDGARHPDDDDQAQKYLDAERAFGDAGYRNYEISNWARPGQECRHNQLYWEQGDYRGFGCAAHSHASGRRWWNVRTPERYIEAVTRGRPTVAGAEELDPDIRALEALQLSLRTRAGVPAHSVDGAAELLQHGLVEPAADRLVLTPAGRLVANEIARRLVLG